MLKNECTMKLFPAAVLMFFILATACESTDDVLEKIDHTVPAVVFTTDTVEVTAGGTVAVDAMVEDASGIRRIEFSYGDWRINTIVDLGEEAGNTSYRFTSEIQVPLDAKKEWEENRYFNDASSIKVIQSYHKLIISAWDRNRNQARGYLYVRVVD